MATQTSSIDDVLHQQTRTSQTPMSVEETNIVAEHSLSTPEEPVSYDDATPSNDETPDETQALETQEEVSAQVDDYGNERATSRTYTEDEVNERINHAIRDRFARMERNSNQQHPNPAQVQQAAKQGFEYNAESAESWQQQLEGFVEQTFHKINQKQANDAYHQQESRLQAEFEDRFQRGMTRFNDFHDVIEREGRNITDTMVYATRSMPDPSAFMYAACKRAPQELERISKLRDPVAQAVEMGKLEEKMRQTKPASKAPRPVSRNQEDASLPLKSNKEPSIEDLIARDAAKRLAKHNQYKRK